MPREIETPVLIIGGGGAGLTASMLLSHLGIESLLVSALPTTSTLPKAHVVNQRAMEILGDVGLAEVIYDHGTPLENMRATAWYAGLAGQDPDSGRRIGRMEAWGAGYTDTDWAAASPFTSTNLPQIRLEPILRRRAEELAPGRVRFHHEVVDLRQDADAVTAKVVDHDDSSEPPQEQLESDQGGCEHDGKTTPLAGGRNRSPGPRDLHQSVSGLATLHGRSRKTLP